MAANIRTINKMIAAKFPGYSIKQENGYVYVYGPDTHTWYSSTVTGVFRVSDLSPEAWVAEVAEAIKNQTTESTTWNG